MVVVAEVLPGGELKLAGLGVAPSNGLKRGVVVNIDATVQSIQQALKEAELMADCKITRVYTGITGSHIRGINSSGMVAVKDKEVTPPTWPAWWRPPRPSTSRPTSACCWWSRRSS
jgi:cell division protein FtsA